MINLLVLAAALQNAPDEAKLRTGFFCNVEAQIDVTTQQPKRVSALRKFAFLMDGANPFTPILTIDSSKVLKGEHVEQFMYTKPDGSLMMGLTPTKIVSLSPGKRGSAQGFDLGLADRNGPLELTGFCFGLQTETTVAAFNAQAKKMGYLK